MAREPTTLWKVSGDKETRQTGHVDETPGRGLALPPPAADGAAPSLSLEPVWTEPGRRARSEVRADPRGGRCVMIALRESPLAARFRVRAMLFDNKTQNRDS